MRLRYVSEEGKHSEVELGEQPLIIGRSPDAGLTVSHDKVSRHHCEIRFWAGDFVLKDLNSRNGTFLNEERVEVAVLRAGDRIRLGGLVLTAEEKAAKGTTTILREVGEEMEEGGKGYRTILREIVGDADPKSRPKS